MYISLTIVRFAKWKAALKLLLKVCIHIILCISYTLVDFDGFGAIFNATEYENNVCENASNGTYVFTAGIVIEAGNVLTGPMTVEILTTALVPFSINGSGSTLDFDGTPPQYQ